MTDNEKDIYSLLDEMSEKIDVLVDSVQTVKTNTSLLAERVLVTENRKPDYVALCISFVALFFSVISTVH